VFETVARVREKLPSETALIGFCGAPWTVATYVVGGGKAASRGEAEIWAETDPVGFGQLIECLVDASVEYLAGQVDAGADALQIFDTWAGRLSGEAFARWVVRPTAAIVTRVKERHPTVPIIGFPKDAGEHLAAYVAGTG
jgi:uroporphyrinogen decarboxylase